MDVLGKGTPVSIRCKQTGFAVSYCFGDASAGKADNGQSHRLRFKEDNPKSPGAPCLRHYTRDAKHSCPAHPATDLLRLLHAHKREMTKGRRRLAFQAGTERAITDNDKFRLRRRLLDKLHSANQELATLLLNQPANK